MKSVTRLIAITGGIGSGKSVVCRILEKMGFPIYDCDTQARIIMDSSDEIKQIIAQEICPDAIVGNSIDRKVLATAVFNNDTALQKLNSTVHHHVLDDILEWHRRNTGLAFVETAILYQSGLDRIVHEVWEVCAPMELRIQRVLVRNADIDRAHIEKRISAQDSYVSDRNHRCVYQIINDGVCAILPQIEALVNN